ncbi:MAG: DUF1570 domain-containing protein [Planctomycetia bacterium]|jgi:hypothetical protein
MHHRSPFTHPLRNASITLLAIVLATMTFAVSAHAESVYDMAVQVAKRYSKNLQDLADWCDEKGLVDEAAKTREWNTTRDPRKVYIAVLPREIGTLANAGKDLSGDALEWHKKFRRLREKQADTYFALARRAVRLQQASLAFDLAMAAIHEDPDHQQVRKLLGYRKYKKTWSTPYEIKRYRAGQVDDEKFGWIREKDLERYKKGERRSGKLWISAEEDAQKHRNIENGWKIETEHYVIVTNHSIEVGVRLGRKMEVLYDVWKRLFIRYYATQQQVMQIFNGRNAYRKMPVHKVMYFRDREDYIQNLSSISPTVKISVGFYMSSTQCMYSFAGEGKDEEARTLYHEGTHQLFQESRRVSNKVGAEANFWIVEGLATYMESLRKEKDCYVLGNPDDQRMKAARHRYLKDKFYIPMEQLTAISRKGLQTSPHIRTLYSQIAGVTHFLISYDGGRYRDPLINYISAVYNGNQDPELLEKTLGTSYEELDRLYGDFLKGKLKKKESTSANDELLKSAS